MKKPILLLIVSLSVISCKKEKLEGEAAILIGTWNWTETFAIMNGCDADTSWNYVKTDSTKDGSTYHLIFEEKGKVAFYHNDGLINKNRIVFDSKESIASGPYSYKFVINANNDPDRQMNVWVGQDSLLLDDFPKDSDDACKKLFNHFIKG